MIIINRVIDQRRLNLAEEVRLKQHDKPGGDNPIECSTCLE
jgi:hypothetical protein